MTKTSLNLRARRRRRLLSGAPVACVLGLLLAACQSVPPAPGEQDPAKNGPMLMRLADDTRAGGDPGTAVGLYQRAAELEPNDPAPLAHLGDTLAQLHDYDQAAAAYRAGLKIKPNQMEGELHRGLALTLLAMDRPQAALSEIEAAQAKTPNDPQLYNVLGVTHDLMGQHRRAQDDYRQGLKLAPANVGLRNNYGLSLALSADYAAAATELSALANEPGASPRHRLNLALVYGLAGDDRKAAEIARTALDERAVSNNLAYYAMLRSLDDKARASAIIGGHPPSQALAEAPAKQEPGQTPSSAGDDAAASIPLIHTATPTSPPAPVTVAALPPATKTASASAATQAPMVADAAASVAPSAGATAAAAPQSQKAAQQPAAAGAPTPLSATAPQSGTQAAALTPSASGAPAGGAKATATADAPLPAAAPPPAALTSPPAPAATVAVEADASSNAAAPKVDAAAPSAERPPTASPSAEPQQAAADAPAAPEAPKEGGGFVVQLGSFASEANAHKLADHLNHKGYDVAVMHHRDHDGRDWFVVRAGGYASADEAAAAARHMREAEQVPAMVVHLRKPSQA